MMIKSKKYTHICVTDLDGTLLNDKHEISGPNLQALEDLGKRNVCRVAATGRSLYSLQKVLYPETPFDFVIFSTGAGVMDWREMKIILSRHIDKSITEVAFKKLITMGLDFMFHAPIPENHRFVAVKGRGLADFHRRVKLYQQFSTLWDGSFPLPIEEGTQFLAIGEELEIELYERLVKLMTPLKVIRTTSPLDHVSLWIEIFSPEVSKGSAVQYLLDLLGILPEKLMVVGNDYNDVEMLRLTNQAYVTFNAPEELKNLYNVVSDYSNHGFAQAVNIWSSIF